jgi:hypothetical protein
VSKQDSHFIRVFSLVIGTLATIAIVFFIIARYIGAHTQEREVLSENEYIHKLQGNVAPSKAKAVAGRSTAGPAGAPATGASSGGLSIPTTGKH